MKKTLIKMLACLLIALSLISVASMSIPVNAAGVSTYIYEETNFSFKNTCNLAYNCDGMFLDVYVRATASNNNNETITLKVYIENRNVTKTYTFLSDGQTHSYKNIYLGLSGGSSVRFIFTGANPEITINTYLKVVS